VTDVTVEDLTSADVVTFAVTDSRVCLVEMANPPVNALAPAVLRGLDRALDEAEARDARVIVLSSAVSRFFAAGADIKTMAYAEREQFVTYGEGLRSTVDRLASFGRPTIAAIEGFALGGGTEIALACTLRIAGSDARFSLPEVKLGLIPSAGATQRLPRLVSRGTALTMMLTGEPVGAEEAQRIGLVDRLTEPGQALTGAVTLAEQMSAQSLPVLRDLIDLVDASFETPMADGLAMEVERVLALFDGPDAREGMQAFLEKRPARFV
jgi:enoyl-CoA hydratase/carnithine racemase